ncbi:SWI/SNF and RSC complex subunit Ssr3 [Basidiobolus ranarum]|uniref:SWI/SNF and RSC complex subunit Ssr3 n=1 Tax=Basidiobolus ranarum TaxID=34480 RepID=A0ABR2WB21_9FUNG
MSFPNITPANITPSQLLLLRQQLAQQSSAANSQNSTTSQNTYASPSSISSPMGRPERSTPESIHKSNLNKRRKIGERGNIKTELVIPESAMFEELQGFEKQIDAILSDRKQLIQENTIRQTPAKKTVRVFISNLSSEQPEQGYEIDDEDDEIAPAPSWTLRIEGRLLDVPASTKSRQAARKFSSFLRSVIVELDHDPENYPEGELIEWHKSYSSQDFDGFEIKRRGDQNVRAKIILTLDNPSEKYKFSQDLIEVIQTERGTQSFAILALWDYIKVHGLRDEEQRDIVNNDEPLRKLFGTERMNLSQVPELLWTHFFPPDPVIIEYTIRADKEYHISRYAYDMLVDGDEINKGKSSSNSNSHGYPKEIVNLDEKIMQCIQSMGNSKSKRDFLLDFSKHPVRFIDKYLTNHCQESEVAVGESVVNLEDQRNSEFYKQPWVDTSVVHYLSAKTQQRMQELMKMVGKANT